MTRRVVPDVDTYTVKVRAASPQSIRMARFLGALHGRGINGQTGTIRYGYPAIGDRAKFGGYANTPQLFTGYDPRKVAAGAFRGAPTGLPSTSSPPSKVNNPLQAAMANVTAYQLAGY